MPVDFYELLGVERDAETGDIKQAFRQKAREYHPDVNDDERATAQFTVVRKAYEVLTDDAERADYDRLGHRTYVEKRLDGLNKFKFPGQAGGGSSGDSSTSSSSSSSSRSTTSGSSSRSTSSSSGSTSRSSSRSSWSSSGSSSSGSSSSRSSSGSSSSQSSSGSSSSRSSGRTTSSSSRTSRSNRSSQSSSRSSNRSSTSSRSRSSRGSSNRTTSSGSRSTTARTGGAGTTSRFEKERTQSGSATNSGPTALWYGWSVTLLVLVAYFASLGRYLTGEGAALVTALVSIDTAAPVPALLAASPLSLPSLTTLQTAVSASPTTLVLPGAAAILAVSLVVIVTRFGHSWTTWLYALAAIVPVVVLAAGAVGVARPLVVDVAGLVVCPLLGAGGFVVDAGRYLFATR